MYEVGLHSCMYEDRLRTSGLISAIDFMIKANFSLNEVLAHVKKALA